MSLCKHLVPPTLLLALVAGCTPSAERTASSNPTPTAAPETAAQRCVPSLLTTGTLHRDSQFSGDMTPADYSESADVQAALLYDQFQSGSRTVLTTLTSSTAPPAASPAPTPAGKLAPTVFASCVSMRFADEQGLLRFLLSYKDLRRQAGNLAQTLDAGKVGSLTDVVAYQENGQSFQAYGVDDANVIELAGRAGTRLFIATVAGSAPALDAARALTEAMATA